MRTNRSAILVALAVAAFGCAGTSTRSNPGGAAPPVVTGTVTYRERVALPGTAMLLVQLVDVSRADAPAVVLAEQFVPTNGRQVPFAYTLAPYPTAIVPGRAYSVQARIENAGSLLFISDRRYPVLTQGAPSEAQLVLRMVAAPPAEP